MSKILSNNKAISMVEIIVSAIVFTLAAAGFLATTTFLSSSSSDDEGAFRALQGHYIIKGVFQEMRNYSNNQFRNDDTVPFPVAVGTYSGLVVGPNHTVDYTVTDVGGTSRDIDITVNF